MPPSSLFEPISGATPDEVARRRKRGEGLLTQGTSVAPLAHWTAAHVASGPRIETAQARNDERAGQDSRRRCWPERTSAECKIAPWLPILGG